MPSNPPPVDTWLWDSSPVPLSRPATPIAVAVYDRDKAGDGRYRVLDNLQCLDITTSLGTDPGHATFRYVFDGVDTDAPQSIEQALDPAYSPGKIVNEGDYLVVRAGKPDGTWEFCFYGQALVYSLEIHDDVEEVRIVATGYAKLAWDTPIPGALIRDAADIDGGDDYQTDLVAQFNPKGKPNATPEEAWARIEGQSGDRRYPTFLDPAIVADPDRRRKWTLAMAARYVIFRHWDPDSDIRVPDGADLDLILVAQEPKDGQAYDPDNPSTYDKKDIIVSDRPITGRDWPTVLNEMIRDKGFAILWDLEADPDDALRPVVSLRLRRLQTCVRKEVYLPAPGSALDPEACNLGRATIARDINQVISKWRVVGGLKRYEASFVLAAGFPMSPADSASLAALAAFDRNSETFDGNSDKHRLFVFDECGEGHYANGDSTANKDFGNLDDILGQDDYTGRRRKPIGELISTDATGKPRRFSLAVSKDSTQDGPAIWDRSGTWQEISGGYQLLKDRLGIRVTADNPNAWKIGESGEGTAPFRSGVLKLVQGLTNPNAANPAVRLRLTCVIEGDAAVEGLANPTGASPLSGPITRVIDARDRYRCETVTASSIHNDGGGDIITRDDKDDARAEAIANRLSTECGILEGSIVIPRFTRYYGPSDRIDQIKGRNLGFRTDRPIIGSTAVYPTVVAIRHDLADGQATTLRISDQDGHRHKVESKIRRT